MHKQLIYFSTFLSATSISFCSSKPGAQLSSEKFNVLFIVMDDLNDWTSLAGGHPQVKTPNMDRLYAMNAMVMLNAQSPATVCCPSRSSFLTGLRPSTTGVYGNQQNLRYSPAAAAVPTMPQYFSQNGYFSLSTGKIFHGHVLPDGTKDNGEWAFDLWENSGGNFRVDNAKIPLSGMPGDGNKDTRLDWGPTLSPKEETSDWKSAVWAANKIKAGFNKPFFMMVGIYRPHLSWYIPQEYFDRYDLDQVITPQIREDDLNDILTPGGAKAFTPTTDYNIVKKNNKFKEATRAYLACVSYADDCLGVVLDALENSPYKDNTIVVVAGDHGWFLGEKLRFRKNYLWEESCRVPLIIKTPGMSSPSKSNAVVNLLDLYPTLAELCGLGIPSHCEGSSFVPVLENPALEWYPSVTTDDYKSHSVRSRQYRYNSWANGTQELYDHFADSMEWNNLINDPNYTVVINELKSYLPTFNAPPSIKNSDLTSDNPGIPINSPDQNPFFKAYSRNSTLIVEGINHGDTVEVYSISGQFIGGRKSTGGNCEIKAPSGIYLVKSGDSVQKVVNL
jgi:arylsulfatase A-like enzyme